jgi:hypothetical protein
MEENLMLVILRDLQARFGGFEQRMEALEKKLGDEVGGLRMLAIHRHDETGGSNHGAT